MASDRTCTLRLELRDDSGDVVGEVEAKLSERALRGLLQRTPTRSTNGASESEPRTSPRPFRGRDEHPTKARGDERAMSSEQRKFLFRLAYSLGFKKDRAEQKVLEALGVERLEWATRSQASRGIDSLKEEIEHSRGVNGSGRPMNGRDNGHGNGARHG